jgi:transcriptional regulator with XRE-family HTH domain
MIDDRFGAEVERLLKLTQTALRLLNLSNREVERRMGLSPSYLSRLFGGTIELKVQHVLAICDAAGLHPVEFFRLAYPEAPEPPSEAATALFAAVRPFRAEAEQRLSRGTGDPRPEPAASTSMIPEPPQPSFDEALKSAVESLVNLARSGGNRS